MALIGVAIGSNFGGINSTLISLELRNSLTISVTSWIWENLPDQIYRFEQDLLAYFCHAPTIFVFSVVLGVLTPVRIARSGVWLPLGYAITFGSELIFLTGSFKNVEWYDMVPAVIYQFCLAPVFLIGAHYGNWLRRPRFTRPKWKPVVVTVSTMLALAVAPFINVELLMAVVVLLSLVVLAWVTRAATFRKNVSGNG